MPTWRVAPPSRALAHMCWRMRTSGEAKTENARRCCVSVTQRPRSNKRSRQRLRQLVAHVALPTARGEPEQPRCAPASGARACSAMEGMGPKLGDAASLWNFTPSPGAAAPKMTREGGKHCGLCC